MNISATMKCREAKLMLSVDKEFASLTPAVITINIA
jgi:hypothetical protein